MRELEAHWHISFLARRALAFGSLRFGFWLAAQDGAC